MRNCCRVSSMAVILLIISGCAMDPERAKDLGMQDEQLRKARSGDLEAQAWLCKKGTNGAPWERLYDWEKWGLDVCLAAAQRGHVSSMWYLAWQYNWKRGHKAEAADWMYTYYLKTDYAPAKKFAMDWKEEAEGGGFQWGKFAAIAAGTMIGGQGVGGEAKTTVLMGAAFDSREGVSGLNSTQMGVNMAQQDLQRKQEEQAEIARAKKQKEQAIAAEAASNERLRQAAIDSRAPAGQAGTIAITTQSTQQQPTNSAQTLQNSVANNVKEYTVTAGGVAWSSPNSSEMNWEQARSYCNAQGSRLPTLGEIKSLLNSGVDFNKQGWSKPAVWTADSTDTNTYASVNLSGGYHAPAYYNNGKSGLFPDSLLGVVCVR